MSTIHHRPVHPNLWWYAAAAVLTGAVLALILATLQVTRPGGSGQVVETSGGPETTTGTRTSAGRDIPCRTSSCPDVSARAAEAPSSELPRRRPRRGPPPLRSAACSTAVQR